MASTSTTDSQESLPLVSTYPYPTLTAIFSFITGQEILGTKWLPTFL